MIMQQKLILKKKIIHIQDPYCQINFDYIYFQQMEITKIIKKKKQDLSELNKKHLILTLEESYGCYQIPINCNCFISGSNLIYLNANYIVLHNIIQSTKKFVKKIDNEEIITAMACNSEGQFNIAVGSISKKQNSIIFYSDYDQMIHKYVINQQEQVIDIYFINNMEFLSLITSQTTSYLIYRTGSKSHKNKQQDQIIRIQLNQNCSSICQVSQGKVYLINKKYLYAVPLNELNKKLRIIIQNLNQILDAIFFDSEIIIVLTRTTLSCYKNNQIIDHINFKQILNHHEEQIQASCILKYSKGFIVTWKNIVALSLFTYENQCMTFVQTYYVKQNIKGGIISANLSNDQMNIALTVILTENSNIQYNLRKQLPIGDKLEPILFNLSNVTYDKVSMIPFNRLFKNTLEYDNIINITGCMTSSCFTLVKTKIFVYQYQQYFKRIQRFNLNQIPLDLAVHPWGIQLACIFKQSLRIYIRIEQELIEIHKEHKQCTCISFSSSGLLAIGYLNNLHYEVQIYNSITFKTIKILSCFSSKHSISKIYWNNDDTKLFVYAGSYEFHILNIFHDKKQIEFYEKKKLISFMLFDEFANHLIVTFTDGTIKLYLRQEEQFIEYRYNNLVFSPHYVTYIHIEHQNKMIFFGLSGGAIKWCSWPLEMNSNKNTLTCEQILLGSSPITKIFVTINLKYIMIGSMNGIINILRIKKRKNNKIINIESEIEFSKFKDLVMNSKVSLEQVKQRLKNLLQKRASYVNQLDQLKKQWEIKQKNQFLFLQQKNDQSQKKGLGQIIQIMERDKIIKNNIQKDSQSLDKRIKNQFNEMEQIHNQQMLQIYKRSDQLKKSLSKTKARIRQQYEHAQNFYNDNMNCIKNDFQTKINIAKQYIEQLKDTIRFCQIKQVFLKKQTIEQQQVFKSTQKLKLKEQQKQLTNIGNEMKAKISKHKKQIDRYYLRSNFLENKRKYLEHQVIIQRSQQKQLRQIKNSLIIQLINIQNTTNKREKLIRQYSMKNQKLTNFKEVYTYLQNNLVEETSNLQKYSTKLSNHIQKINQQLVEILNKNTILNQNHTKLKTKLETLQETKNNQIKPLSILESTNNEILYDIGLTLKLRDDYWKPQIQNIFKKYFSSNRYYLKQVMKNTKSFKDIHQCTFLESLKEKNQHLIKDNLIYQKKYFQQHIERFKANQKVLEEDLSSTNFKLQAQNSNFITECNILKQKLHKKKKILKQLQTNIKIIQSTMANLEKQSLFLKIITPSQIKKQSLAEWFPVHKFEPRKNSQIPYLKIKSKNQIKEKDQNLIKQNVHKEKKTLLDIRRVITAQQGLRNIKSAQRLVQNDERQIELFQSKPPTNQGFRTSVKKRRQRNTTGKVSTLDSTTTKTKTSLAGFCIQKK